MLGLGWTEMLVIGVVALIVIGPKDLPVVMNRIGKMVGQVRRLGSEFQRELNKATGLDEVRNLRNSITEPLRKSSEEIRREFNAMTPSGPKPSGLIKPADSKAESVVEEIKAAAGMSEAPKGEISQSTEVPSAALSGPGPIKADAAPARPLLETKPVTASAVAAAGAADAPKPSRTRKKPVPVLPTEPADSPTTPVRKPRTRTKPSETSPSVLPTEPADSPAAPTPRAQKPRKVAVSNDVDVPPVEDR
jgi:sec-independent protein translocase protein TatB